MVKLISRQYCALQDGDVCEFIVDTDADFANLPEACTGSTALSVATGNVYIVNASGNWVPFGG